MRSELPDGWRMRALSEVCSQITSGSTPARRHADRYYSPNGHPWVKTKELRDRPIGDTEEHITDAALEETAVKLLPRGTLLMAIYASPTVGRLGILHTQAACNQACAALLVDPERADHRFVFYGLLHQRARLQQAVSGSAQQNISGRIVKAFEMPFPPVEDQDRIASVLGTLDDKIDSNRRLAVVLEEIAGTSFHAGFVDFIADDHIDRATPLRDGWTTGTLGDVGTAHREFVKGEHAAPYIGLDLMPRGSTVLTEWLTEDAPTGQTATFERGDILFGKLRPYFRKVGVAPIAGRCSMEILVLRPTRPEYYGLLLGHAASGRFIEHCDAVSRGTRMPRAEWKDASTFEIAMPPVEVAAEFSQFVRTLYSQIVALTHQSRTLVAVRDVLLPKLISGEIRVPDTADPEEVIGPAAEDAAATV